MVGRAPPPFCCQPAVAVSASKFGLPTRLCPSGTVTTTDRRGTGWDRPRDARRGLIEVKHRRPDQPGVACAGLARWTSAPHSPFPLTPSTHPGAARGRTSRSSGSRSTVVTPPHVSATCTATSCVRLSFCMTQPLMAIVPAPVGKGMPGPGSSGPARVGDAEAVRLHDRRVLRRRPRAVGRPARRRRRRLAGRRNPYSRLPLPAMFTGAAKQAVALQKPPQSPSTAQVVRGAPGPPCRTYTRRTTWSRRRCTRPRRCTWMPWSPSRRRTPRPGRRSRRPPVAARAAPVADAVVAARRCAVAEHIARGLVPVTRGHARPDAADLRAGHAAPLQAVLQHTPSTQLPLAHWLPLVHAVPLSPSARTSPPGSDCRRCSRCPGARRRARRGAAHVRAARRVGDGLADARAVARPGGRERRYVHDCADAGGAGHPAAARARAVAGAVEPAAQVESCVHSLRGWVPAVAGRHRPLAAPVSAPAHALQLPVHAVSQHTPSTQLPLAHSGPAAHTVPSVFGATHMVPIQARPPRSRASDVHDVLHTVVPHAYAPHDVVSTVWHVPATVAGPGGRVRGAAARCGAAAGAGRHRRHAPRPSHMPSRPQLSDASGLQSLSGSLPPGMVGRCRRAGWSCCSSTRRRGRRTRIRSSTPSAQNRLAHSPARRTRRRWPSPGRITGEEERRSRKDFERRLAASHRRARSRV